MPWYGVNARHLVEDANSKLRFRIAVNDLARRSSVSQRLVDMMFAMDDTVKENYLIINSALGISLGLFSAVF
jgi:hypothetical protein